VDGRRGIESPECPAPADVGTEGTSHAEGTFKSRQRPVQYIFIGLRGNIEMQGTSSLREHRNRGNIHKQGPSLEWSDGTRHAGRVMERDMQAGRMRAPPTKVLGPTCKGVGPYMLAERGVRKGGTPERLCRKEQGRFGGREFAERFCLYPHCQRGGEN